MCAVYVGQSDLLIFYCIELYSAIMYAHYGISILCNPNSDPHNLEQFQNSVHNIGIALPFQNCLHIRLPIMCINTILELCNPHNEEHALFW